MPYPPLPPAVDAERIEIDRRSGRLSYYVKGDGPPLLLLHSVNAAASVFDVKPIFDASTDRYSVYAPDLPGFGFSDRSSRDYNVSLYTAAIADMLDIIDERHDCPVHALAISLSSEFLARVAVESPQRFRSLTLVTPTGFNRGSDQLREAEGSTRAMPWLSAVLEFRLWRSALYKQLVRPSVIRYFLRRSFGSDQVDQELAAYCDLTAHQPGAANAPYAFLSGRLFSKDIRTIYEAIACPVWLPHGIRGDFRDFSEADWARNAPGWTVQPFATGAMPHFEMPQPFLNDLHHFLQQNSAS